MQTSGEAVRASELARVLGVAWKNISAYPPGHPIFIAALNDAHAKLATLAALSGTVTLGVGRDSLFLGTEKIQSTQAQKLAEAFYKHGVALIAIDHGIEAWELEMLFRFAAADSAGGKRTLWDDAKAAGITHVELTPVDYSAVQTTGEVEEDEEEKPRSLFEDILKAILSGRELSDIGVKDLEGEAITAQGVASILLHYLDTGETSEGGGAESALGMGRDEVIDQIIDRVASHLDRAAGETRQVTIHQIADLLRNLPREIQERVLHAAVKILSTDPSAEEELRSLARVLAPDEILHALSTVRHEGLPLSSHALRLLQDLMITSTAKPESESTMEEAKALADQIATILGNEDIDRFNPPEHKELLQNIDLEVPATEEGSRERALELGRERLASIEDEFVSAHVRDAVLEMVPRQSAAADLGPAFTRLEEHFLELLGTMQMAAAVDLVDSIQQLMRGEDVPPHVKEAAHASMERIGTGDAIQVLVDWLHLASDDLIPQIRRIIDLFGTLGTSNFLYALAEENDRSRRRRLFDFLVGLGPVIVPDAISLLSDSRWYVVRNMVTLLRSVGDRKSLPEIRKLTTHGDIRVRLEAIKSLIAFESRLPIDLIEKAIRDPDPKVAETAIALCGSYGIAAAEGPLLRIVAERDWFGRRKAIRLKCLRALAELGRPETLERLEPLLLRERLFSFRDPEERRLAYELLESYPVEARERWVEQGLRSRDATIRAIARRLSHRSGIATAEEPA